MATVLGEIDNGVISVPITLSGTGTVSYVTPSAGSSVPTKINIPNFSPAAFGQIIAMGLPSGAPTTCRVISVFDARASAHQPSLLVLSADESTGMGISFDGNNSEAVLKHITSNGVIRMQGDVNAATVIIGPSSLSAGGQFTVQSGAAARVAGVFDAAASPSAPVIRVRTSTPTAVWEVWADLWQVQAESTTNPTSTQLSAGNHFAIYRKADIFVIAYNNGGTITYLTIPLDGSTTTWTQTTSAP